MKGAMPDTQDQTGRTALHQAAVQGDVDAVELLLSGGANPNTQDAHLQTPVTLAAERGLDSVVKALADHSATDINLQDSFGRTPLHWCAKRCDVKGAEALLATGRADVAMRTTGGDTALHWACSAEEGDASGEGSVEERSLRVTELLVAKGADLSAKNGRGEKPLDLATDDAVRALLLSASQELDAREEEEVAEAERHRAPPTPQPSQLNSVSAGSIEPSPAGANWPGKQPPFVMGLPKKQGGGKAIVGGAKKKIVIKLKKKSP